MYQLSCGSFVFVLLLVVLVLVWLDLGMRMDVFK